jgi:hypothetical protein
MGDGFKERDKGKQEVKMPFLSKSTDNWIASLRSPSPKKPVSPTRGNRTLTPKSGQDAGELPNVAFFLNKF